MSFDPVKPAPLARYERRSHGSQLFIAGALIAILLALFNTRITASAALLPLFVVFTLTLGGYALLTTPIAIEAYGAGNVDFIARMRRESFPLSTLARVEGETRVRRRRNRSSTSYKARFVFKNETSAQIVKTMGVLRPDDSTLQEFVRQLQFLNPQLDAAQFWTWSETPQKLRELEQQRRDGLLSDEEVKQARSNNLNQE